MSGTDGASLYAASWRCGSSWPPAMATAMRWNGISAMVNSRTSSSHVPQRAHFHWRSPLLSAQGVSPSPPPPPGTTASSSTSTGAKLGAGSSSTSTTALPRGMVLLRRHPFLVGTAFVVSHLGIAWALLPPTYFVIHHLGPTGGANALLAGPQTAWLLAKPVPSALAASVPGFNAWAAHHGHRIASNKDGKSKNKAGDEAGLQTATFEDLLEFTVRSASKTAWRGAKSTTDAVAWVTSLARGANSEADSPSGGVKKQSEAALAKEEEEIADEAAKSFKASAHSQDADGGGGNVTKTALHKLGFSRRAQNVASDIRFGQVRDAVAAYVFVKTLLPLRVPLSAWLAPKLARVFLGWRRRPF